MGSAGDDPYLYASEDTQNEGFYAITCLEMLVCVLSIAATVLHYRKARQFNQTALFHTWHCLYCISIASLKAIEASTMKSGPIKSAPSWNQWTTCTHIAINQNTFWLSVNLTWVATMYYFFSRFDYILTGAHRTGWKGRQRWRVYATFACFMATYNVVVWILFGTSREKIDGSASPPKCYKELIMCHEGCTLLNISTLSIEMALLTKNFWKASYQDRAKRSANTYFKMTVCVLTTASAILGNLTFIIMDLVYDGDGANQSVWEIEAYVVPSYFTLYFLWNRHYLGDNIRVNVEDDDLDFRNAKHDDDFDIDDIEPHFWQQGRRATEMSSIVDRSTETNPMFVHNSTISTLSSPSGGGGGVGAPRDNLVLVLPQQATFKLRPLLGTRHKLVIEEDLRPPDSTPMLVHLFVSTIALPEAEAHRRRHQADTRRLLDRYAVQELGSSSDETDAIAALEKRAQYEELKEQAEALSQQVSDWVAGLQSMPESLPTEPVLTRDSVGVKEGWRPFKPSRAKNAVDVALWPTNLHRCGAVVRAPSTRPLSLTCLTYGAPSGHAFGFKSGGWGAAEKKLQAPAPTVGTNAAGGFSGARKSSLKRSGGSLKTMMPTQARAPSPLDATATEALDQLRLKFNVSGRSCMAMSQALAAAVAAAVQKLTDAVLQRNGVLVRQWVSIGLLVHEVSLLSTRGKEHGMLDDMATALDRLNLTVRLVLAGEGQQGQSVMRSADPNDDSASLLRVAGLRSVPQSRASDGMDREASAPAAATSNSRVTGRKVVTLEVHSREAFAWLVQQLTHGGGSGGSDGSDGSGGGGGGGGGVGDLERGEPEGSTAGALDIVVLPVMMTLGVNEVQTVANAAGDTNIQTEINRKGLQGLRQYLGAFREFQRHEKKSSTPLTRGGETLLQMGGPFQSVGSSAAAADADNDDNGGDAAANTCTVLLSSLEGLIDSEASLRQRKIVDLLMKSCFAARLLNGARTTSCKSAKDRTSMFYTLELVRLAEERGLFDGEAGSRRRGGGTVQKQVLELLRGVNGVRLQNCRDNIGTAKFSFNRVQVAALPAELQPPPWTIGGARMS